MHPRAIGAILLATLATACATGGRQPTGDGSAIGVPAAQSSYTPVDVQFMQGMIHHHAQALAMTALVPERTTRADIRTLAGRIEVSQRDEIAMMRDWLRDRGERAPDPDSMSAAHQHQAMGHAAPMAGGDTAMMPGMLTPAQMRQLEQARGGDFDRLFLTLMIQHHQGAVAMVQRLFATPGAGQDNDVFRIASDVNVDQITEIERMRSMLVRMLSPGGAAPERQTILITGSTDGLGREVARTLAATGAHIIVHGRNRERGEALVAEIAREGKGSARFYAADLASLAEVRGFAEAVLRDHDRLDVLINNAGVWLSGNERRLSVDGHEMHFAVNYLAGYLLTRMLLPRLVESAPSRIINVASIAQSPIDVENVMLEGGYSDGRAYGQSKLAQILFTVDLARELEGKNVFVAAVHPATMMNTTMVLSRGARPRATVEEGVEAVVNLVTATALESGQYFNGTRPARPNAQAHDEAARERLRRLSMELTKAP